MADMIRKVVKHGGHSMMSNFHLTDRRLSWKAKGLLSALLSLTGEYTIDELAGLTFDGRIDTRAGLKELQRYGYLTWEQNESVIEYTVYERPVTALKSLQNPSAELPNAEDIPDKTLREEEGDEKEDETRLRERLDLKKVAEKCSENFVEAVFRELCRRDAEFRQIMTAGAFENVCLVVWERQRSGPIQTLSGLINMYFDNITLGIRSVGGGNEPAVRKENLDISLLYGYDRNK